jgi:hypothetical protein
MTDSQREPGAAQAYDRSPANPPWWWPNLFARALAGAEGEGPRLFDTFGPQPHA